jgi:glutathione peroxidase
MARRTIARIAVVALATSTAALTGLDRRAALRWAGASAGLVAERVRADDAVPPPATDLINGEANKYVINTPAVPQAADVVRPAIKSSKLFEVTLPFKGNDVPLSKFKGEAHLVVNIKMDDPVAGPNFNAMRFVAAEYPGLRVWAVPTDQGYMEPDVSELVRAKAYQQFNFGTYPTAVVFDKVDVVGGTRHPLYSYLASFPDPNGVGRLSLNFEKFLLDGDGRVLRRYPRKFTAYDFEADIAAAVSGKKLPPPSSAFKDAWVKAASDAKKGEYSFRGNYNVWDQSEPSQDWAGLAELGFT